MEENNSQLPQTNPVSEPTSQTPYAGFVSRYAASVLDGLITGAMSLVLAIVFIIAGSGAEGIQDSPLLNLLSAIVTWGYFVYFTKKYRATWGKKFFKLRVESVDGKEMTWGKAILREVLGKLVSALVLMIGYIWFFFDGRKQTWHDKFAKTVVVQTEPLSKGRKVVAYLLAFGIFLIAIVGLLAVIVLVTLNPAEQLERTREAQQRSEEIRMETQQQIDEMNSMYETPGYETPQETPSYTY